MKRVLRPNQNSEKGDPPTIRGLFGSSGPYLWIFASASDYERAEDHFCVREQGIFRWRDMSEVESIPLEDEIKLARTILTMTHEDHHYFQILSSPLGFFEFNFHQMFIGDMHQLFYKALCSRRDNSSLPIPLLNWAVQSDSEQASIALQYWNNVDTFQKLFWLDTVSTAEYGSLLATMVTNKMLSQSAAYSHHNIKSEVNVGTTLSEAWSIPTQSISTFKIIESHADIHTAWVFHSMPLSDAARNALSPEIYNSRYVELIGKYSKEMCGRSLNLISLLTLLDLALLTPIAPPYYDFIEGEMLWEDLHPACRLHRIFTIAKKIKEPDNWCNNFLGTYNEYVETISKKCGWPSVIDLHKRSTEISCILDPEEPYIWRLPTKLLNIHSRLSQIRLDAPGFIINPESGNNLIPKFINVDGLSQYAVQIMADEIIWPKADLSQEEMFEEIWEFLWFQCVFEAITSNKLSRTRHLCQLLTKHSDLKKGEIAESLLYRLNAVSLTGIFVLEEESFLFNPVFSWEFSIRTDGFRSSDENSSQLFDKRSYFFCGSFKKKNDCVFHFGKCLCEIDLMYIDKGFGFFSDLIFCCACNN